jgi:cytochrome c biogenesis protein CcdA
MLKFFTIYIGVFVASILTHYTINWTKYMEGVRFPPLGLFIVVNALLIIEVSILSTIAYFFAKKFHLNLLASPYKNFAIGFLFSLLYTFLITTVIPNIEPLNKDWLIYIVLPVLIFLPLICMDYLLRSRFGL